MDMLNFFYTTIPGRLLLRPLITRPVSYLSGLLLDSHASKILIKPFVQKNNIDTQDYELSGIHSFNDFFCRRIKKNLRPVPADGSILSSPCDGLLSVYKIHDDTVLSVKQSKFTIRALLRDKRLAAQFDDGYALVFRLCVQHYHRYIYFDSGKKYQNRKINGVYHTVRPIALENTPVFIENTREYAVIDTENFGRCVQMEVGAMLVGRIVNLEEKATYVQKATEKGYFEFGGSTVIVLMQKNRARLRDDIAKTANTNTEIPVKLGEAIGESLKKARRI